MDYDIYPFKRYGKYRLYVQFEDQYENEVRRSTGITYPLDATKKTRQKAKKKAATEAKEIVQEYLENNQEPYQESPNQVPRLKAYLKQDYWPYVEANCAESTLVSYQGALGHFVRICKDRPMDAYRLIDIERYKQRRLSEDIQKTTINIEMRSIKAAFSWAFKYNLIDRTPYKGQHFMFDVESKKRSFTIDEIKTLFKATKGENIGIIVRLAYYTGMRIGEMLDLTWDLVYLEEHPYIHITKEISKTNTPRNIPLSTKALDAVESLERLLKLKKQKYPKPYEDRSKSEIYVVQKTVGWGKYAVNSVQAMFRRAMNKAGLPKELTFHCLRHSFATHVLEKGGQMYKVSRIMGHSNTQVTQKYYDHSETTGYHDTADLL